MKTRLIFLAMAFLFSESSFLHAEDNLKKNTMQAQCERQAKSVRAVLVQRQDPSMSGALIYAGAVRDLREAGFDSGEYRKWFMKIINSFYDEPKSIFWEPNRIFHEYLAMCTSDPEKYLIPGTVINGS